MTYEEAKAKLKELHTQLRMDMSYDESRALEEELWKLAKECYESEDHDLHTLGYWEFNYSTEISYCDTCLHIEECPIQKHLEDGEIVDECYRHAWRD